MQVKQVEFAFVPSSKALTFEAYPKTEIRHALRLMPSGGKLLQLEDIRSKSGIFVAEPSACLDGDYRVQPFRGPTPQRMAIIVSNLSKDQPPNG